MRRPDKIAQELRATSAELELHIAAQENDVGNLSRLLTNGTQQKPDVNGRMPLHHAAFFDSKEAASVLLDNNADYNARDIFGRTPAHTAVVISLLNSNNTDEAKDMLNILVRQGADLNLVDGDGLSALRLMHQGRSGNMSFFRLALGYHEDDGIGDPESRALASRSSNVGNVAEEASNGSISDGWVNLTSSQGNSPGRSIQ